MSRRRHLCETAPGRRGLEDAIDATAYSPTRRDGPDAVLTTSSDGDERVDGVRFKDTATHGSRSNITRPSTVVSTFSRFPICALWIEVSRILAREPTILPNSKNVPSFFPDLARAAARFSR